MLEHRFLCGRDIYFSEILLKETFNEGLDTFKTSTREPHSIDYGALLC